MKNRLSRIFNKDGKTVILAVDHGYFMGPTQGLENLGKTVNPLLSDIDALMLTRGALRNYINPENNIPIVLRISGGTSILSNELLHEGIIASIKDAIRLNSCAVAFSIMVGANFERDTLLNFTKVIDECNDYGIPVLAVTAVGRELKEKMDARYIALACRISAELGASFVKTYYCENFEYVVNSCPVPIIVAGGKKIPEKDALQLTYNAIRSGAKGVDMGRNIFQSKNPIGMVKAIKAIVHENKSVEEAFEIFEKM